MIYNIAELRKAQLTALPWRNGIVRCAVSTSTTTFRGQLHVFWEQLPSKIKFFVTERVFYTHSSNTA